MKLEEGKECKIRHDVHCKPTLHWAEIEASSHIVIHFHGYIADGLLRILTWYSPNVPYFSSFVLICITDPSLCCRTNFLHQWRNNMYRNNSTCIISFIFFPTEGVRPRMLFDKTVSIKQLNVVEAHGILIFRADKGRSFSLRVIGWWHACVQFHQLLQSFEFWMVQWVCCFGRQVWLTIVVS